MFTYKAQLHNCIFKEVIILLKFGAIRITFDFLGLLGLYTCFAAIPCILKVFVTGAQKNLFRTSSKKTRPYTQQQSFFCGRPFD